VNQKILPMKRYLLFTIIAIAFSHSIYSQTYTISGAISDNNGDNLLFANVIILENDKIVTGTESDIHGNYSITVEKGTYTLESSYIGYTSKKIIDVKIDRDTTINFKLEEGLILCSVTIVEYAYPPISTTFECYGIACGAKSEKIDSIEPIASKISESRPIVNLYPNPASHYIIVDFEQIPNSVQFISSKGEVLREIIPLEHSARFDLLNCHKGAYFVRLIYDDYHELKKVIVAN